MRSTTRRSPPPSVRSSIAPELADAHSTLGFTLFQGRLDARAAREPFERSRELGCGRGDGPRALRAVLGSHAGATGRPARRMERALLLDRLNPLIHRAAGAIAYAARRWEDSIAAGAAGARHESAAVARARGDRRRAADARPHGGGARRSTWPSRSRISGSPGDRRSSNAKAGNEAAARAARAGWSQSSATACCTSRRRCWPSGAARCRRSRALGQRRRARRFRADLRPQRSLPRPAAGRCAVHAVAESPGLRLGCDRAGSVRAGNDSQGNYMRNHDDGPCGRVDDAGTRGLREEGRAACRGAAPASRRRNRRRRREPPPADETVRRRTRTRRMRNSRAATRSSRRLIAGPEMTAIPARAGMAGLERNGQGNAFFDGSRRMAWLIQSR